MNSSKHNSGHFQVNRNLLGLAHVLRAIDEPTVQRFFALRGNLERELLR